MRCDAMGGPVGRNKEELFSLCKAFTELTMTSTRDDEAREKDTRRKAPWSRQVGRRQGAEAQSRGKFVSTIPRDAPSPIHSCHPRLAELGRPRDPRGTCDGLPALRAAVVAGAEAWYLAGSGGR